MAQGKQKLHKFLQSKFVVIHGIYEKYYQRNKTREVGKSLLSNFKFLVIKKVADGNETEYESIHFRNDSPNYEFRSDCNQNLVCNFIFTEIFIISVEILIV